MNEPSSEQPKDELINAEFAPREESTTASSDLEQLGNFLNLEEFEKRYVDTLTRALHLSFNEQIEEKLRKNFRQKVNERADEMAFEIVRRDHAEIQSLAEAKQLGKAWGKSRGDRELNSRAIDAIRLDLVMFLNDPESEYYSQELYEKMQEIRDRAAEAKTKISELRAEFSETVANPEKKTQIEEALTSWAKSIDPFAKDGEAAESVNAGIVHYFAYYADPIKSGRFAYLNEDRPNIDGFINYTKSFMHLLDVPDPNENDEVAKSALLSDQEGNEKLLVLTNQNLLVIGFKSSGADKMQIVTAFPYSLVDFDRNVREELSGIRNGVANALIGQKTVKYYEKT